MSVNREHFWCQLNRVVLDRGSLTESVVICCCWYRKTLYFHRSL